MNARPAITELLVLGIETSCDETAAAVVRWRAERGPLATGPTGEILSNVVRDQIAEHTAYGGVVPELAARAHVEVADHVIERALADAGVGLDDLDGIAATAGPGLIGGVMIGLVAAKALALVSDTPLIAVNHLEGHALTVGLTDNVRPPYLLLLVSGGHTQLLAVQDVGNYIRLGTTIDDALGEAFDKTAKLLGLGYPGGPAVEQLATRGDGARFQFPRPLRGREAPDFSFAGLKTAVRQAAEAAQPLSDVTVADICASFQTAVVDTLTERVGRAFAIHTALLEPDAPRQFVVAGGVAANLAIGSALTTLAKVAGYAIAIPPPALCSDNGAMIAWAGAERLARGWADPLDAPARARWPLDDEAPARPGAGVKA